MKLPNYLIFAFWIIVWLLIGMHFAKADQGRELFKQNCVVCHGEKADGNGEVGRYMVPRPRNLNKDPFVNGDSVQQIENTIKNGFNQMPAFSGLTDDERHAIAIYVRSLRKKE